MHAQTELQHPVNGVTKRVLRLDYEAYTPMAILHLQRLAQNARSKYPSLIKIAIAHRIGVVPIAEESVIIVASSPHRREALEATGWMIDELKATVPIWKKEIYEDGSTWKENCECGHRKDVEGKNTGVTDTKVDGRSGHLHHSESSH